MRVNLDANFAQTFDKAVHKKLSLVANAAQTAVEANPKRASLIIENLSSNTVAGCLGDKPAVFAEGLVLRGYGSTFEINPQSLFVGKVAVISDLPAELRICEATFT